MLKVYTHQKVSQQHSNFVTGMSTYRTLLSKHASELNHRRLSSFGFIMNTATSTSWKNRQPVRMHDSHRTLFRLAIHDADVNCSRISMFAYLVRTPDSFVQSNFLMCLSAPRNHSIGQRRCRIRPCSSAQARYWSGRSKSPIDSRDRDRLVDANIDSQIGTSLKVQPLLEPRFDPYHLHIHTRDLHFVFRLCVSLRVSDNESDNSQVKSWHTTCLPGCCSIATPLTVPSSVVHVRSAMYHELSRTHPSDLMSMSGPKNKKNEICNCRQTTPQRKWYLHDGF